MSDVQHISTILERYFETLVKRVNNRSKMDKMSKPDNEEIMKALEPALDALKSSHGLSAVIVSAVIVQKPVADYEARQERLKQLAATLKTPLRADMLDEYTKLQWLQATEYLKGRIDPDQSPDAATALDTLCDLMVREYANSHFDCDTQEWEEQ